MFNQFFVRMMPLVSLLYCTCCFGNEARVPYRVFEYMEQWEALNTPDNPLFVKRQPGSSDFLSLIDDPTGADSSVDFYIARAKFGILNAIALVTKDEPQKVCSMYFFTLEKRKDCPVKLSFFYPGDPLLEKLVPKNIIEVAEWLEERGSTGELEKFSIAPGFRFHPPALLSRDGAIEMTDASWWVGSSCDFLGGMDDDIWSGSNSGCNSVRRTLKEVAKEPVAFSTENSALDGDGQLEQKRLHANFNGVAIKNKKWIPIDVRRIFVRSNEVPTGRRLGSASLDTKVSHVPNRGSVNDMETSAFMSLTPTRFVCARWFYTMFSLPREMTAPIRVECHYMR